MQRNFSILEADLVITLKSGEVTKELFDKAQFFAYAPSGSMVMFLLTRSIMRFLCG